MLSPLVVIKKKLKFFSIRIRRYKVANRVDIFRPGPNLEARSVFDFKELAELVGHIKGIGMQVVLTQGTYDMWHIGHARYLQKAKSFGDILIVGVDSDEKVKRRKGPDRPLVPEQERIEVIAHSRYVDIVVLKEANHPHWHLIKTVRPDVLIASKSTPAEYTDEEMQELLEYCGKVEILEPQATTSTSAKIRLLQIRTLKPALAKLREAMDTIEKETEE